MRNTRLAGHTLLRKGRPYHIDGCSECVAGHPDLGHDGYLAQGYGGHARCSCGDASGCLDTNAERKRWHAEHKEEIRRGDDRAAGIVRVDTNDEALREGTR